MCLCVYGTVRLQLEVSRIKREQKQFRKNKLISFQILAPNLMTIIDGRTIEQWEQTEKSRNNQYSHYMFESENIHYEFANQLIIDSIDNFFLSVNRVWRV